MSRPFTVTTEQVREWLSATEKRKAAILIHELMKRQVAD